ncbi:ArsR family transcriptional regulator [Accumulibacter sp.]|uniref:ArsR family transcriptional regulator n=1 Tax=Accumulibacter sp. TaxID=2053492 RepID=UPI0025FC9141|nr:ArsR family transcriptional regulator [Accumulibacter sp.]MCM8595026.1 ArsR family transcriptional regulator [Accumulibacter sp.]MCM8625409.1 ArsR family transcriptional regulator [Accumulibacter sp.]MDS4049172.1 ArsR family transcriptional regulator [Accumulibacter sp.]
MTEAIVAFLRSNGEQLDVDMAEVLNIPIAELREQVARLAASGDVICCRVTRFIEGRKIEGISCRLSCDPPTPARGRKPGGAKREDDSEAGVF